MSSRILFQQFPCFVQQNFLLDSVELIDEPIVKCLRERKFKTSHRISPTQQSSLKQSVPSKTIFFYLVTTLVELHLDFF